MLRLQRYNLDVVYKPGSQMLVADHLSRAFLSETDPDGEDVQFSHLNWKPWTP